jgi:hypothetical protein
VRAYVFIIEQASGVLNNWHRACYGDYLPQKTFSSDATYHRLKNDVERKSVTRTGGNNERDVAWQVRPSTIVGVELPHNIKLVRSLDFLD